MEAMDRLTLIYDESTKALVSRLIGESSGRVRLIKVDVGELPTPVLITSNHILTGALALKYLKESLSQVNSRPIGASG